MRGNEQRDEMRRAIKKRHRKTKSAKKRENWMQI